MINFFLTGVNKCERSQVTIMADLAMSVKETAAALGISESTAYWMVYQGELPHRRVKARGCKGQGRILISRKAVEKWLEGA